jgi:GAG-pre-integrase domain
MIKGDGGYQNTMAMVSKGFKSAEVRLTVNKNNSVDKSKLKCSHCGGTRHVKEQYFQVVGYPEWYIERRKNKQQMSKGKAALATAETHLVPNQAQGKVNPVPHLVPNQHLQLKQTPPSRQMSGQEESYWAGSSQEQELRMNHETGQGTKSTALHATGTYGTCEDPGKTHFSNYPEYKKPDEWIIDSGATDHMTYSKRDFVTNRKTKKNGIFNANGVTYPVEGAGDVPVSENITLKNTLFVPSLSTKLISIGQLTEERNCVALMFPNYVIFQDILTKEVIGRGTKRDGLYYLDEVKIGKTYLSSTKPNNSRETILLWHKRLGHPSFGYLKKLSPHLFVGLENDKFVCETCIKAKSHKTSYFDSDKRSLVPFDLVHTDV